MKKFIFVFSAVFFYLTALFAENGSENPLLIKPSDIRLESVSGGYNLFIRKKAGLESVMLVETTKDPAGLEDNYAFRAEEYNPINGDEIRVLDGNILKSRERGLFFLIDSTPQADSEFGQAFLIFIPETIVYGYSWTRQGSVKIGKGTFMNIRGFEKKHCDYTGAYLDNPYMFDLQKRQPPVQYDPPPEEKKEEIFLTDDYNPVAAEKFKEISDMMIYSKGPETILDDISEVISKINPKDVVDIVFAIDATGSMEDEIQVLRERLAERLTDDFASFGDVSIGLLFYRDYGDNFNTRGLPVKLFAFTKSLEEFKKRLFSVKIRGTEGGDIPEAVYEALFASMDFYRWRENATKQIILIGDAEPHPTPRRTGRYSKELVERTGRERGIGIAAIIMPDNKSERGR